MPHLTPHFWGELPLFGLTRKFMVAARWVVLRRRFGSARLADFPNTSTARGNLAGHRSSQRRASSTQVPVGTDQAVALRRRRLRHPLVAHDDSIEFAGRGLWHRERLRRAAGARPRRRDRHRRDRRDQHPRRCAGAAGPVQAQRRFRPGRVDRRAIEPVSPRARHRAAVPRCRHPRRHGRLPCVGMPVDAGRTRGRARRLPGDGRGDVRGRGRGPARHHPARRGRQASSCRSTIS